MTPNDEKLNKLEEEAKKNAEEVLSDEDLDQAAGGKMLGAEKTIKAAYK